MSKKGDNKSKEYLDNWKRSQAELENLKKRVTKERAEFAQFASKEIVLDLLPILDNFERATEHVPSTLSETDKNWLIGITYIQQQLLEMLKNHQVEKYAVNVGDDFNPTYHNAVSREESDQVKENQIIKVISQAYTMASEVIRPASVIVAGKSK